MRVVNYVITEKNMKKAITKLSIFLLLFSIIFRLTCGIFIIQPIGAIPKGATIVYWRLNLNLPFIASVDSILEKSGQDISLFGRMMVFTTITEPIVKNKIINLAYSEKLYLISTKGKKYIQPSQH